MLQQRTWHTVWALLASLLSLTMLYLALKQVTAPWDIKHHAHFRGAVLARLHLLCKVFLSLAVPVLHLCDSLQVLLPLP